MWAVGTLLLLVVDVRAGAPIRINRQKLDHVADRLGLTALIEERASLREMPAAESLAATPQDLSSGDFEIKCSTSCAFVRASAVMESMAGGAGEAALEAADELSVAQEKLKATQESLRADPNNQALQAQEITLQADVNEKTAALQAAVGGDPDVIDLEGTAAALAAAKKNAEDLAKEVKANPNPQLQAQLDLAEAEVRKLQAHLKASRHKDSDVDAEVSALNARLQKLKAALAANPEDGEVQAEVEEVQKALDKTSAEQGGFKPARECYRVCMNGGGSGSSGQRRLLAETETFMGLGDINNCIRMCVKVMRHLVYNMTD